MQTMRLAVLISGSGSNLQAIIDASEVNQINAEIAVVISNKPAAGGLEKAKKHGIACEVLNHQKFSSRADFDSELKKLIDSYQVDLVVLAGFMRILTPEFVEYFSGRMMNIHPSLLPLYQGLHTHRRALEAGDKEHGVTVHFVTAELDGGPSIIQARVPVKEKDSEENLANRVLKEEHYIYPKAVGWFCEGRLKMQDGGAWLDDTLLPSKGIQVNRYLNTAAKT